jgi:DNA-binding CsgD family transcriptional regulator
MEKTIEQLQIEYEKLLDTQSFVEENLDYSILEEHIPYLENICELSNSAIMIFDLFKREHVFVSKNISRILSLDAQKSFGEPSYINKRIHPDDLFEMHEAGLYFLRYGFSLTPRHRKDSKLVNEYRILNEKNKYIRVIEQQMCLENDSYGNLWLALGISDISPDQSQDAPFRSRLIDIRNGNVYMFPPPNKEAMLTARETEILQLISKGLISKQIADKLYISVNTVNTHRQRILEKLKADNSLEAIKYASKLGLI